MAGTPELGPKRLVVRGLGPAEALVCWGLAELQPNLGVVALVWPGWREGPRPGCAAGAGSAGSAAGEPSFQRISAAPCGRTDGQPAAADAGTPTAHTDKKNEMISNIHASFNIITLSAAFTHSLPLSVHDGFQFFKVSQFDLELLHLSLHQESHQRFDLPLFHCSEMLLGDEKQNLR